MSFIDTTISGCCTKTIFTRSCSVTPAVGGQQPASAPAAETAPSRNTLVLASYLGSAASEQMGLPADRAHPLRVVGCHSITGALRKTEPLYDDPDDWILQLESPVALYTGGAIPFFSAGGDGQRLGALGAKC